MGGERGFYGCERVSLGKSHRRFFKKPPVEILKTTGDFFENHRWFYLAGSGIVPKKGWDWTKESQGRDQFEGMRLTPRPNQKLRFTPPLASRGTGML